MSELALVSIPKANLTMPRLYNVEGAAASLGRTVKTIYRLVEKGELGHYRVAGRLAFGDVHIHEYLARCERPARVAA